MNDSNLHKGAEDKSKADAAHIEVASRGSEFLQAQVRELELLIESQELARKNREKDIARTYGLLGKVQAERDSNARELASIAATLGIIDEVIEDPAKRFEATILGIQKRDLEILELRGRVTKAANGDFSAEGQAHGAVLANLARNLPQARREVQAARPSWLNDEMLEEMRRLKGTCQNDRLPKTVGYHALFKAKERNPFVDGLEQGCWLTFSGHRALAAIEAEIAGNLTMNDEKIPSLPPKSTEKSCTCRNGSCTTTPKYIHPAKIELAAKTAHEVNRAYCRGLGDDSQPSWEDAPEWQKRSAIDGAEHIALNPNITPEESHEFWMSKKYQDGWSRGEKKDAEKKTHPCFVAYENLPLPQRAKDTLFGVTVRGVLGIELP